MAGLSPSDSSANERARSAREERIFIGSLLVVIAVGVAVAMLLLDVSEVPAQAPEPHEHGSTELAATHSSDVLGFAVEGVAVVAVGVALRSSGRVRSRREIGLALVLVLLYLDGVIHWLAVSEHLAELPSATFFVITGAVQISAAPLVWRRERALWFVGAFFTVFLIELYLATRFVPAPFATEPESFEFLGSMSKVVEFAILGALVPVFGRGIVPRRLSDPLIRNPPVILLLAGTVATEVTVGIEAIWDLLSIAVFWITSILLVAFIGSLLLAYRRESRIWSGVAWSLAALLVLGHVLYAVYYGTLALVAPVVFCVMSGALLAAPLIRYAGDGLWGRIRGSVVG